MERKQIAAFYATTVSFQTIVLSHASLCKRRIVWNHFEIDGEEGILWKRIGNHNHKVITSPNVSALEITTD